MASKFRRTVKGDGTIQSDDIAHMLSNFAGALGYEDARGNRDVIAEVIPSTGISMAQRMTQTCLENNYKDCGF